MYARTYGCMILKKMSFYLQRKRWWSRSSGDCLAHRTPVETAQFCHLKTREEKQTKNWSRHIKCWKRAAGQKKAVCDVPDGVLLWYWKVWSLAVCHSIVMRDNKAAEQDSEDQMMWRTNWVFFFCCVSRSQGTISGSHCWGCWERRRSRWPRGRGRYSLCGAASSAGPTVAGLRRWIQS